MTFENISEYLEEHVDVAREEYEMDDPQLVGEPIRTLTGGFISFYTEDESCFVIFTNSPDRYNGSLHVSREKLEKLGGGVLEHGMAAAVQLLNNPILDEDDDNDLFFTIANQIQRYTPTDT